MHTIASTLAQDTTDEPWQRAARSGSLRPAETELLRRIGAARQRILHAEQELGTHLTRRFLRPQSAEDAVEYDRIVVEIESEVAQARREIERDEIVLERVRNGVVT